MLKSMTGFARVDYQKDNITTTAEIKCLNGKQLDINVRLPRELQIFEMLVREAVKSKISRGSVTININIEKYADKAEFNIDMEKAKSIYEKLNKLRADLKIKEVVKLEQILVFSELLKIESTVFDEKMYANIIRQLLNKGLLTLDQMRVNEGKNIEKDVLMRVKKIQQVVDKIRAKGLDRIPTEREKYRQKIAQLFEGDEIDEQRIYMEMVILSDKLDISEECVRLDSHIKYFFASLKEKDSVGRKINFLMQEMNREINTIGSKVNDAEISQLVVVVKEEIERIREQIQNVE
jgi:uncharacterized protein (TIGR00255 family)